MKDIVLTAVILLTVMLSIPLIQLKDIPDTAVSANAEVIDKALTEDTEVPSKAYESFRIKITESGEIKEIAADDYIFGVVSAEMPALYEEEALKAQAVAAYTFACRRADAASEREYDLTDDPETDQCYISREQAQEKWGDNAEKYTEKIENAIEEVSGYMLTFDGSAALTVYHAISSGITESCENVWGTALPYLISVESVGDRLAEQYLSEAFFTADELTEALSGVCKLSGAAKEWFGKSETTKTGRVKSISVCGSEISGSKISKALSLRSSCFEVSYSENKFVFTVKGYGHGVGMSQNGANYMAKQGSDYKEILSHYYPGCTLEVP